MSDECSRFILYQIVFTRINFSKISRARFLQTFCEKQNNPKNNKPTSAVEEFHQMSVIKRFAILLCVLFAGNASAATVTYSTTNIGSNTWQYDYTVTNDTLSVPLEEFTIYFDVAFYANLVLVTAPISWDPFVANPDPLLPDDGFFDVMALSSGIAPGDSLSGFSIKFDYLASGTPGAQFFDIVDPITFNVLESGFTTPATTVVPVPAAVWLFGSGLLVLIGRLRPTRRLDIAV